jgi:signal transduction histidine kinase
MSVDEQRAPEPTPHPYVPLVGLAGLAAMAVTVLGGMAQMLYFAPAPLPRAWLALLGTAYLLISTIGWRWADRQRRREWMRLLLGVLTVLATAMMWVSRFNALLMFMPLISLFVLYESQAGAVAVTALMVIEAELLAAHLGLPLRTRIGVGFDYLPSSAFVIVFSQLFLRERHARQQLRLYAAQVEQLAITSERNRLAREIHDTVGHYLTVVHVQIEAARALLAGNAAGADECLTRAEDIVRDGLGELRRSVTMLRGGAVADRPFGLALAALVEESRASGLDATLTVEGTPRLLAPAVEFTLYRAAQEAFTNVQRHARARQARLTLRYADDEVQLAVADDGVGAAATDSGFGLTGVRERAQLVGGAVSVLTAPGSGFTLDVRVPL